MIVDQHDLAFSVGGVQASAGVGDAEGFDTEILHDPDRKDNLVHGVAFVKMEASLHGYNIFAGKGSENQFSMVGFNRGYREVRNVAVIEGKLNINLLDKSAEACSKNNTDWIIGTCFFSDKGDRFLDFCLL